MNRNRPNAARTELPIRTPATGPDAWFSEALSLCAFLFMWFNLMIAVSRRTVDAEKWLKSFRKLIENIDFLVDVNKLPLKARYRRRVRSGAAPEGWCHAPAVNAGERASPVQRGTFLPAAPCRRGGEGVGFRRAAFGGNSYIPRDFMKVSVAATDIHHSAIVHLLSATIGHS